MKWTYNFCRWWGFLLAGHPGRQVQGLGRLGGPQIGGCGTTTFSGPFFVCDILMLKKPKKNQTKSLKLIDTIKHTFLDAVNCRNSTGTSIRVRAVIQVFLRTDKLTSTGFLFTWILTSTADQYHCGRADNQSKLAWFLAWQVDISWYDWVSKQWTPRTSTTSGSVFSATYTSVQTKTAEWLFRTSAIKWWLSLEICQIKRMHWWRKKVSLDGGRAATPENHYRTAQRKMDGAECGLCIPRWLVLDSWSRSNKTASN